MSKTVKLALQVALILAVLRFAAGYAPEPLKRFAAYL